MTKCNYVIYLRPLVVCITIFSPKFVNVPDRGNCPSDPCHLPGYLKNRRQLVPIAGTHVEPQISVLRPQMFLVLVNDFSLGGKALLYSDDNNLITRIFTEKYFVTFHFFAAICHTICISGVTQQHARVCYFCIK